MKNVKEQLEDIREKITDEEVGLFLIDSGYTEGVQLQVDSLKIYLWDDQNESRDWDYDKNDYTPFEDLFLKELDKAINRLKNIKKQVSNK